MATAAPATAAPQATYATPVGTEIEAFDLPVEGALQVANIPAFPGSATDAEGRWLGRIDEIQCALRS